MNTYQIEHFYINPIEKTSAIKYSKNGIIKIVILDIDINIVGNEYSIDNHELIELKEFYLVSFNHSILDYMNIYINAHNELIKKHKFNSKKYCNKLNKIASEFWISCNVDK